MTISFHASTGLYKRKLDRDSVEQAAIYKDAFDAMKSGKQPSDPEVMDIAERHRLSIDRWFYPCSKMAHRGLASLARRAIWKSFGMRLRLLQIPIRRRRQ